MEAGQARLLSKILRDPAAVGDLLEAEEPGVETAVTRLVRRAQEVTGGGRIRLSFGGACQKIIVPQVDLGLNKEDPKEAWQQKIFEIGMDHSVVFTDGSMSEEGGVGAGWWTQEEGKSRSASLGRVATVWDGEIGVFRGALGCEPQDRRVIIVSDSQAAIAAVKNAGKRGKARTKHLKWVVDDIERRQSLLGPGAVTLGWVKAHVGIYGNEKADAAAKKGAERREARW